ncbi:MAG: AMP-binding protein [Trebonia sp.]
MSTQGESFWSQAEEGVPVDLSLRYDDLLDQAVAAVPDREAVVFLAEPPAEPVRLTYAEIAAQTGRIARALLAAGITRGATVAVYASNRPEFVPLQFACARIGVALASLNPAYGPDDLEFLLGRSGTVACFAERAFRTLDLAANVRKAAANLPGLRSVVWFHSGAHGDGGAEPDGLAWSAWLAGASTVSDNDYEAARAAAGPDDIVEKMFTSGTTGRPKGVRLRSSAIANGGRLIAERCRYAEGVRVLHAMPFFHCGGTVCAMASAQAMRGTTIFPPAFSPSVMAAAADAEGATAFGGVPTMLIAVDQAARAGGHSMDGLRTVLTGGAPVPEAIAGHWAAHYGVGLCNTYGMTEVAGSAVQTAPDDPAGYLYTTVGRPLPGVAADVVEPGTQTRVSFGMEGEIRLRGWGTMEGYDGDPDGTAATLQDGWVRTGDLGSLAADGYLRVTGRLKDLIIRGGENISPVTVEDAIRAALPEVLDISVVGVPDEYHGEAVAAFMRLRDGAGLTAGDVRDRLASALPRYLVPTHVRLVDEFPTTPSGKIQKYRLREEFLSE